MFLIIWKGLLTFMVIVTLVKSQDLFPRIRKRNNDHSSDAKESCKSQSNTCPETNATEKFWLLVAHIPGLQSKSEKEQAKEKGNKLMSRLTSKDDKVKELPSKTMRWLSIKSKAAEQSIKEMTNCWMGWFKGLFVSQKEEEEEKEDSRMSKLFSYFKGKKGGKEDEDDEDED